MDGQVCTCYSQTRMEQLACVNMTKSICMTSASKEHKTVGSPATLISKAYRPIPINMAGTLAAKEKSEVRTINTQVTNQLGTADIIDHAHGYGMDWNDQPNPHYSPHKEMPTRWPC